MRIEHAPRLARRSRSVAKAGGGVLVEVRPFRRLGCPGHQGFVAMQGNFRGQGPGLHLLRLGQNHDGAQDVGQFGRDRLDDWHEAGVGEEHAVFGMADDVDDVGGRKAGVDGVADRADAGDGVVELEVAVAVHGQRADAVAEFDAHLPQQAGKPAAAALDIRVGRAHDPAVVAAGDHLGVGVVPRGMGDQRRNHQFPSLHQALHVFLPVFFGFWPVSRLGLNLTSSAFAAALH